MKFSYQASPVGELLFASDGSALTRLAFHATGDERISEAQPDDGFFRAAAEQLAEYFAGTLRQFDIPLELHGTQFQRRVWTALLDIPYGQTISYGELADRVGSPGGARAVGLAVGSNPIAIVVPCHRVVGADGRLTGYGGGLSRKQFLLDLEARHAHLDAGDPVQLALDA
jgi:methylated-DNA-[protein]-cysteine S-methyltransferase